MTLQLTMHVTLGNLLNFSNFQFPEMNNSDLIGLLVRLQLILLYWSILSRAYLAVVRGRQCSKVVNKL